MFDGFPFPLFAPVDGLPPGFNFNHFEPHSPLFVAPPELLNNPLNEYAALGFANDNLDDLHPTGRLPLDPLTTTTST
jgi:hypothetical protein